MKRSRFGFTGRAVVIVIVVLLLADGAAGALLLRQNRDNLRQQIDARMLDIANSAAALLDGDALGRLTAEDAGTPEYQAVYDTLATFQRHIDLAYIYGIRAGGDGTFSFTVDPDPVAPGEFGQPIVSTPALQAAAAGTPGVDAEPHSDDWGRFYSAYSPVYDSAGRIAGIVGVDFDADWYDAQLQRSSRTVAVIIALSVVLGALLLVALTGSFRKRFRDLGKELTTLADDMETLTREAERSMAVYDADGDGIDDDAPQPPTAEAKRAKVYITGDEISALGERIRTLQGQLRDYLAYTRRQACTDALSGVGSRAAYLEMLQKTQKHFDDGTANFCLTVFDVDGLKSVNDNLGHVAGDRLIAICAKAIVAAFGDDHVYRIGGDEFVAVRVGCGEAEIDAWSAALDEELARRQAKAPELPIGLSWGSAVYDPATDPDFRSVFARADRDMYETKEAHHRAAAQQRA